MNASKKIASVSAATRSQTFTAINKTCRTYHIDAKQLLSVYGKKLSDVPAGLKKAWIMAHQIARNYGKANAKATGIDAALASAAP